MLFKEAHDMFLEYQDAKGHASSTNDAYRRDAKCFMKFLNEKGIQAEVKELDSKVVRRYNVWLKNNDYAMSTIKRRLDSLSSFFQYMEDEEIILSNPLKKVDRPKVQERVPHYLTRSEVDRLVSVINRSDEPYQIRDKAVLFVLLYCGLRRSELCNLDFQDVNFKSGTLTIRQAKNKKDRIVPMNEDVQKSLWEHIQSRLPLKSQEVFLNRYKNRINADTLARIIKKYVKKAGILKNVTPHCLRHTCGTLLIESGVDIVTVKELLGHADINSTMVYTHTSPERLAEAVNRLLKK